MRPAPVLSILLTILVNSFLRVPASDAAVWHVDDGAPGGVGTSWSTAFNDLQVALTAANPTDEIWVATGIYTPDSGTGDRNATFQLLNGVAIYGGFLGGETSADQRDPDANPTILSGDLLGDDLSDFVNNAENSYHVVTGSGTDSTAVLDGFIITGGNANGLVEPHRVGGGMYNHQGSPTITDCTFRENWARFFGAGMYNEFGSSVVTDCMFSLNVAKFFGGGVANRGSDTSFVHCDFVENRTLTWHGAGMDNHGGSPTLADCTFIMNSAESAGGAVANSGSSASFTRCTFLGNTGTAGGACYNASYNTLTYTDCVFGQNVAVYRGGAITNADSSCEMVRCRFFGNFADTDGGGAMYSISFLSDRLATLIDCTFTGNTTTGRGGALYNIYRSPALFRCAFDSNSADGYGGAISFYESSSMMTHCSFVGNSSGAGGGGIWSFRSDPTVINCLFARNRAEASSSGGGVANLDGPSTVINCTFVENNAGEGGGGGLFMGGSSPTTVRNCVFWENFASGPGAEIALGITAVPDVSYCNIRGGFPGKGNIDEEPEFINPEAGDYRVRPHSPCVDAGDNSAVPADEFDLDGDGDLTEPIPFDLAGRPRFRNQPSVPDTGNPAGLNAVLDMGAYEAPGRPGDINGNGVVNLADFALFARCFGLSASDGSCSAVEFASSDLTDDGSINLADFATFAANFGG